jgi:uncharacterized linocin/CFP29 family protein
VSHLHRHLAPMSAEAWAALDSEARRLFVHFLAGRRLVDFDGPHGWAHSAVDEDRVEAVGPAPGSPAQLRRRVVRPLLEIRVPFSLERLEVEAIERGAQEADLEPLREAVRAASELEDRLIFDGIPDVAAGIGSESPHPSLRIGEDYREYPSLVARAVAALRDAGVGGPFGIALGPRCHRGVVETTEMGGLIVFDHLERILGGPIVWAPAVDGAVVLSVRGGDFELVSGQDLSLGYTSHDEQRIHLYIEESLTFRALAPEAAVRLVYEG